MHVAAKVSYLAVRRLLRCCNRRYVAVAICVCSFCRWLFGSLCRLQALRCVLIHAGALNHDLH